MRLGEEAIDVVIHETPGEIVGYVARYEGIEADTHVDVGQSVKADQQRKTAKILVPVIVPLIGPDRVGDEFAIERQRERPGPHPDDFGRVPVRHDAEYRPAAVQVGMRAAEQLDLARDIGERGVDLRVRCPPLAVDGERADLQKVELPVVADGEFHVDCITRQKGFELADQSDDRRQRRRAGIRPRFEAKKSLEIVADTGGHAIGQAGTVVVIDNEIGAAAGTAREDHPGHRHAVKHGLHEDLVVVASVIGERVNHPVDCLCHCRAADDTEYGIVLPGLGASRRRPRPVHCYAR